MASINLIGKFQLMSKSISLLIAIPFVALLPIHSASAQDDQRVMSCDPALETAANYVRSCRQEAANFDISDPEFNSTDSLVTWATNPGPGAGGVGIVDGQVFVGIVDPQDGRILESTVRAFNARPAPRRSVRNGPEWAYSSRGTEIFFSCLTDDSNDVQLCRIDGTRGVTVIPGTVGQSMRTPSSNPDSSVPKIYVEYLNGSVVGGYESGGYGVREDNRRSVTEPMPPEAQMGRWLPSGRALLHVQQTDGGPLGSYSNIILYDTVTGVSVPLFDDGRSRFDPQPWEAPELGGELAFSALVLNETTGNRDVETYRRDANGNWVVWREIDAICSQYPNAWSPEPLVFQGFSYLTLNSINGLNPQTDPGITWIAAVDPPVGAAPTQIARLLSNDSCEGDSIKRRDPESMIINNGNSVRVYYLETP